MATRADTVPAPPTSSVSAADSRIRRSGQIRPRLTFLAIVPYIFLLPFLLVFLAFFVAPFIYDISQSVYTLQHGGGLGLAPPSVVYVGFDNYRKALTDPNFWDGFRRVILFGLIQIPVMMTMAMVLALLMDSALIRFRRFFRLAAFAPYAVPGVVAAILWGFFYTPKISPITHVFTVLGATSPDFLSNQNILWSIGNIATWEFTGYNMIIFFSALQALPQEVYESGRLDGLNEIGVALRLKLPMIRPAIVLGLLFSLIGTLQLFNEPQILKNVSGSITATYTPNIFAYNIAIVQTNFYYGGAIAAILGALTFVFSFLFMRLSLRQTN